MAVRLPLLSDRWIVIRRPLFHTPNPRLGNALLRLRLRPAVRRLKEVRDSSGVEGTEVDVASGKDRGALNGLRDGEDVRIRVSEGEGKEDGKWSWPPWKSLPERYKLIGATSLAFVICNMDKVLLC